SPQTAPPSAARPGFRGRRGRPPLILIHFYKVEEQAASLLQQHAVDLIHVRRLVLAKQLARHPGGFVSAKTAFVSRGGHHAGNGSPGNLSGTGGEDGHGKRI
ncbi:MAG: hypothetical protein VXY81_12070, partial [Pseudomonadota bacterium]|nr:hypothetical protein [Pseudomonadota bacterium]